MSNSNTPQNLGGALMVGGAAFIAYQLLIKPAMDKGQKQVEEAQAGSSPVTQQALNLRSALDPTFTIFNGTNKNVVRDTATSITDLNAVSASYTKITSGRSLQSDLEKCLTASEYQAFINQVNANRSNTVTDPNTGASRTIVTPFGLGFIIFAKANLNLRRSPEIKGTTTALDRALMAFNEALGRGNLGTTNIIGLAKAGDFIGYFTGTKPVVDQKSNTKFIEVCYVINGSSSHCPPALRGQTGKLVKFWISASTNLISAYHFYADVMKAYNGGLPVVMTWKQKPSNIQLAGIAAEPRKIGIGAHLYSTAPAMIYDKDMRSTVLAAKGIMLGRRALSVKTPGGITYHQYTAPNGLVYWINSYATNQPE